MPIQIEHTNGRCHVAIQDEMTIFVAQEMHEALMPVLMEASDIEIDLSQVTEMDGAGLQLMLSTKLTANKRGASLSFVRHSAVVQEVLDLTDTIGIFGDPVVMESQVN